MQRSSAFIVCAAILSATLLLASNPVTAVQRTSGDFYDYDFSTELMGIQVTGDLSYEFEGTDVITLGGEEYEVNVMSISGELSGGILMLDLVSATVDGTAFETTSGAAFAREEMAFYVNLTLGTGQFAQVRSMVEEVTSTHFPPLLSGFDPSSVQLGDDWTETVMVSVLNVTFVDGVQWGDPVTRNSTLTYNVSVADSAEMLITEAGSFECLRITATNDSSDSLVYWWSAKVGNFVRIYTYESDALEPRDTLELTDYRHERPADAMLVVIIGGTVLAIAVVILVIVLMLVRRRPPVREVREQQTSQEPPQNEA